MCLFFKKYSNFIFFFQCFLLIYYLNVYKSFKIIKNVKKNIIFSDFKRNISYVIRKNKNSPTSKTLNVLFFSLSDEKCSFLNCLTFNRKLLQSKIWINQNKVLKSSLNDYIYKLLIKNFKKNKKKKDIVIYKNLQSAKSSYNIDLLFSCQYTIHEIKKILSEYIYELKLIDAENIQVTYLGKKRLVRPIKKQEEAYYILLSLNIYPSLIKQIYTKLMLQTSVLRFIIIKNEKESKMLNFKENELTQKWLEITENIFFKKK